jgi:hypothetical protein
VDYPLLSLQVNRLEGRVKRLKERKKKKKKNSKHKNVIKRVFYKAIVVCNKAELPNEG